MKAIVVFLCSCIIVFAISSCEFFTADVTGFFENLVIDDASPNDNTVQEEGEKESDSDSESGSEVEPIQTLLYEPYSDEFITGVIVSAAKNYSGAVEIPSQHEGQEVVGIKAGAFKDNKDITSVIIPSSVADIGSESFQGCTNLTTVALEEGLIGIGASAFSGCTSLASIEFPFSLLIINEDSFRDCIALTSIILLNSNIEIRANAFFGCSNLDIFVKFEEGRESLLSGWDNTVKSVTYNYEG